MGVNGVYGLSGSGMDIESMVKVGMMSKQNEYDKMAQKFTKNEWLKADYLELSNKITTFNTSTLSQYKMSNNMNAKSVESSNSAVKVSANSSAPIMNHSVSVSELSYNAYLISTNKLTRYDGSGGVASDSTSIELKDILFKNFPTNSTNTAITGTVETMNTGIPYTATETVKDSDGNPVQATDANGDPVVDANDDPVYETETVTHSEGKTYSSTVSSLENYAIAFKISDGVTKSDGTEELKKVEIKFTYQELLNGATLNDLASKINNAGLNIKANYDSVQDQFSLYNKKGGAENTIRIENYNNDSEYLYAGSVAAGFFNNLNLKQSVNGELTDDEFKILTGRGSDGGYADSANTIEKWSFTAKGENGTINVDGIDYTTTDNQVNVGGITYTALNTTVEKDSAGNITATNAATVSVSQDTEGIIEKVKSFVADYNKLLASLYEKYDEKPNSDYKPLTQAQKDQMKDEQIEKWEEKAKKGLLYHDQTLGKAIMNMRDAIVNSVEGVEGKYNSAFSLGISTTGLKGQLVLDEDKLKKALSEDPDSVYNVFAKLDSADLDNSSKSGIAQRLGDIFIDATKSIKDRAGSSSDITEDSDLNNLLRDLQTKMSNFKKLMTSFENALYKKYDNMEATLAKLGTQLNYIMGSTGQ